MPDTRQDFLDSLDNPPELASDGPDDAGESIAATETPTVGSEVPGHVSTAGATPAAPVTPAVSAAAIPPAIPPGQPAAPAAALPVQPLPETPPVAAQPPPVAQAQPGGDQLTPEQVQYLQNQRQGLIDGISQRYTLTPEQKEQFLTEPEKVIPGLVGKLYVEVFEAVLQTLYGQMPRMLSTHMSAYENSRQRETEFYGRWPDLNKSEHKETITRLARAYRMQNPQATREQMINEVGAAAMMVLRIAPSAPPPGTQPQNGGGAPLDSFRPAAPNGAPLAGNQAGPNNPFAEMALWTD